MKQIDVIGLGVSTVDIIALVDEFPGKEGVKEAKNMAIQGGGTVATAIVTLARLGAKTAMIDAVGDDWRGALILKEFRREGVRTRGVRTRYVVVREGAASAASCVLVRKKDGARSIVHFRGPELSPLDVPPSLIESAKFLHVSGGHPEACLQAVKWAHDADVQVSFDGGRGRYKEWVKELVPLTDICIVARDFAERYTQERDIQKAAKALLKGGPKLVVITDGPKGSWIYSIDGRSFHQPAYLLPKVVDTTGCGDSYHGGFLFGLVRGWELEKTASWASAVAALNSQHLGGRAGLPTFEQVEEFLSKPSATGTSPYGQVGQLKAAP